MLKFKKVSILGDSISTYEGVSNNPNISKSLQGYLVHYKEPFKEEDTWWGKTIKELKMNLVVNNSYSASSVSDIRGSYDRGEVYISRISNLHNNNGEKPDIILIYIGVNDLGDGATCISDFNDEYFKVIEQDNFKPKNHSFDESYALMLYKIKKNYPDADVFCLTMPLMICNTIERCSIYNNAIKTFCEHYHMNTIDIFEVISDYQRYTTDGVHPNKMGMKEMTNKVIKILKEFYD